MGRNNVTQSILLLDTNIISYIQKKHPLAQLYQPHLEGKILCMAAQSLAEIRYGMAKANWGEFRREQAELYLRSFSVIYPNDAICDVWAKTRATNRQKGQTMFDGDLWIAATALSLGIPLVTHNKKHFDFIKNLQLISENHDQP
jgi:tRNA(fMet)-specific endonuclease VapC